LLDQDVTRKSGIFKLLKEVAFNSSKRCRKPTPEKMYYSIKWLKNANETAGDVNAYFPAR